MKTNFLRPCFTLMCLLLAVSPAWASYTLTVMIDGSGAVTTNPVFATYPANVTVGLTATPATGWYFAGWSGAVTATTNPVNVQMTGNLSEMASFLEYPTYSLTLVTNGSGTISLSPAGGSYYSNTVVTATATPATGWVFTGWSGATNDTAASVALDVDTNLVLAATFAQLPAFTLEPHNITNSVGSTVTFSSYSVGTAPVAYQWYFSDEPIFGATNDTLTLADATANEAGFYEVTATNQFGSATSVVVALVLTNLPGSTNVVTVCDEAALQAALHTGGWISIGCSGTITLTNTLTITNQVILDGSSVSAIISGGNAVQLFHVASGASLSITNLTLANGSSIVTNGSAIAAGGAIYNLGGTVALTGCTLTNNSAVSTVGSAQGGAIVNSGGTVQIYGSSFWGNSVFGNFPLEDFGYISGAYGFGGAIFNTNGSVIIVSSLLQSNVCSTTGEGGGAEMGGGVYQASGALFMTNCILTRNLAFGGSSPIMDYGPLAPAYGGALAILGGTVAMDLCQWSGNTAQGGTASGPAQAAPAFGGAAYCTASLTAIRCLFSGNQAKAGNNTYAQSDSNVGAAGNGGAIYNLGTVALGNCLVSSNGALGGFAEPPGGEGSANGGNSLGGGIFNGGTTWSTNCTIAQNEAISGQGKVNGLSYGVPATNGTALGGGVYSATNAAFLGVNVTIAGNLCDAHTTSVNEPNAGQFYDSGLASGSQIANSGGSVSLLNSLLAYGSTNGNAYGEITDLGDNISSDGTANFNSGSSYNNTDPLLGPLANNGGPTLTMALSPESPAIDYANSASAPPDDQRGYARPTGIGVISLGAYQYGATTIYIPPPNLSLSIAHAYPNVLVSFTTSPLITNTLHFQSSTNLINWVDVQTIGALSSPSNVSETISPQGVREEYFRLTW